MPKVPVPGLGMTQGVPNIPQGQQCPLKWAWCPTGPLCPPCTGSVQCWLPCRHSGSRLGGSASSATARGLASIPAVPPASRGEGCWVPSCPVTSHSILFRPVPSHLPPPCPFCPRSMLSVHLQPRPILPCPPHPDPRCPTLSVGCWPPWGPCGVAAWWQGTQQPPVLQAPLPPSEVHLLRQTPGRGPKAVSIVQPPCRTPRTPHLHWRPLPASAFLPSSTGTW